MTETSSLHSLCQFHPTWDPSTKVVTEEEGELIVPVVGGRPGFGAPGSNLLPLPHLLPQSPPKCQAVFSSFH